MSLELRSTSLADTHAVAAAVAALARAGDIIVLSGEMGAGKTAFAQGFGRALGVTEPITSPTYTLVHSYDIAAGSHAGKLTLHHADLYRLERTAEVSDLALGELAEFRGIVLVEWGDVVEGLFGDHLVVHLAPDEPVIEAPADDSADADEMTGSDDPADPGEVTSDESDDPFGLESGRLIDIAGVGPAWAARWGSLTDAVSEFRC